MSVRTGKLFVAFLAALFTVLPLRGDELDNYSKMLDRLENGFWRTAFSKVDSTRNSYAELINSMRECAKRINHLEYLNSVPRNSGDLTSNVLRISNLLSDNIAFRKKSLTFSNLKKTNIEVFRKAVAKAKGLSSRSRPIPDKELSLTAYRNFLNEVKDENIAIIEKRTSSVRELNRSQREFLVKTAQSFYTFITELRLTMLKMRQQHPVFMPKKNTR